MRPEVRLRLLRSAIAFYGFLDIPSLIVSDIVMTGSNAAFNYTDMSDCDVHLVVDFSDTSCPTLAENVFTTKKALWTATHDVTIRGQPVELYVEDAAKPANSNGLYSILHGHWLREAKPVPPARNDAALVHKVEALADTIDQMVDHGDIPQIDALIKRLRDLRQNGLLKGGEFSIENLTYKALRSLGYIDALYDARTHKEDASLSLAEKRRAA